MRVGEGSKAVSLNNLHCTFDINKTDDLTKNEARIKIYNANDTTIDTYIQTGQLLEIYAGYEDEGSCLLFNGSIVQSYTHRDPKTGTKITEAQALMIVGKTTTDLSVSIDLSYPKGNYLEEIVKSIADALGFTVYNTKILAGIVSPSAFVYSGFANRALNKLNKLMNGLGYSLMTDNNTIFVESDVSVTEVEVAYLTPTSGLLSYKKRVDRNEKFKRLDTILDFKSLLNGNISVGKAIKVETKTLNAVAVCRKINHKGSNFGKTEFVTSGEAVVYK